MPFDLAAIAALTKISTQKAAAILADDIAVNTSILQETEPKRRLPAVLKVMGGSLAIKAAMIPVALLVSSFAPWAILPMLAVAGLHLATEGAEKMKGEKAPSCENHNQHDANSPACPIRPKTARELEKEKIKEALVIDGVLTAEITVLTLAITAGAPILTVLGVLAATGLIRTGWMYGVVAGLTNMDTGGKWLAEREGDGLLAKTARGIGRGLSKSAPYLMKGISLVGTLALFVIGGELMLHGIPGAEHMVTGSLTALSTNPIVQYAISHIAEAAVGLDHVPDLSMPYKTAGKVAHRAWFSPEEYKKLYEATRERASKPLNNRWKEECENFHDYILFMVNTGLRPDEAAVLELRDVAVETDEATGERILVIEVRGKRGVGYCKSMPGAVLPFNRTVKRKQLAEKPNGIVFGKPQRELLNNILDELELKFDRDGQRRTAYSLRHTYICMRLMEGADIYQVAKNCRTSVEMIEKFYASHIKNTLDASAINVRKEKPKRAKKAKKPK